MQQQEVHAAAGQMLVCRSTSHILLVRPVATLLLVVQAALWLEVENLDVS